MNQAVPFRAKQNAAACSNEIRSFSLTYQQLIELHSAEMEAAGRSRQQVSNRVSALIRFLNDSGTDRSALMGNELTVDFDVLVMSLTDAMRNGGKGDRYVRDTLAQLLTWRGVRERLAQIDILPGGFQECLQKLLDDSGLSMPQVATATKIGLRVLRGWKYGDSLPSPAYRGLLGALERQLGVPAGTLLRRLPPPYRASHKSFRESNASAPRTSFQRRIADMKAGDYRFRLAATPSVIDEWRHLRHFKSAEFLPQGIQRNSTWRLASREKTGRRRHWSGEVGEMYCTSAESTWGYLSAILGLLTLPTSKGGRGEEVQSVATLSVLSDADRVLHWCSWSRTRAQGAFHGGIQTVLAVVMSLLRPNTGYLWQYASLYAAKFPEPHRIYGDSVDILSPESKVIAWQEWCTRNRDRLGIVLKEATKGRKFAKSRDPKEPVAAIICADRPLDIVLKMIRAMDANLAPATRPSQRATDIRDILFLKFLVSNPLRVKHLAIMTYSPDNTGHLYQTTDGAWRLRYAADVFKNTAGAAWCDYDVPVPRSLWTAVERYLLEARPLLANPDSCRFLFLPSSRSAWRKVASGDLKMFADVISNRIRGLTRMYIDGCPGFGSHAFRGIVARDYLKRHPGDYPNLAHLLHDKLATVLRDYADITVAEGLRGLHADVDSFFDEARERRGLVAT